MLKTRLAAVQAKKQEQAVSDFLEWTSRLVNKHGNHVFDGKNIRRLSIELVNDLRSSKITLAEAEEIYLRSSGTAFFGTLESTDL